jgi:hypothetical protein
MVVCKTLVISGECNITTTSREARRMLRAYDKATGSGLEPSTCQRQSGSP